MTEAVVLNEFSQIRYETADRVATITLYRPDRLNAFTATMARELVAAFDAADADDEVRVVLMTGAGRAFCAGADLGRGASTFDATDPVRPAVGVGATMTLPADVRIAGQSARFGFVFARRGLIPEAASSWFLPRVVGISQAMEWVATGRVFDAAEALGGRLVSRVLPDDELLPAARALAAEIAENTSAVSVALARQLMWSMLGTATPWEAHRLDSLAMFRLGQSADAVEGVTSFLEKRPPKFPGRVDDFADVVPLWPLRPETMD